VARIRMVEILLLMIVPIAMLTMIIQAVSSAHGEENYQEVDV